MKKIIIKIGISVIALLAVSLIIRFITVDNKATEDGRVNIEIIDENETVVFNDTIAFQQGDTLFDALNRAFTLTCATATYQHDPSCSFTFQSIQYEGKIILGIASDDFEVMTNWTDSFLAFYEFDGENYYFATQGPSNLPFTNGGRIRIEVKSAWGS